MYKTLFCCSLWALSLGALANNFNNSLNRHLNSTSNTTNPARIQALDRNVYYGGSFMLRNQLFNTQLINFDAPYINAGCGGIDLYGGSLSFISKEQFNLLLKSIASNAVGYSFNLALTHVCPTCSQVTESLQRKVQMLNQYLGNSCALAQGIVNDTVSAITGSTNNKLSLMANIKGFGDSFASFSGQAVQAKQEVIKDNKVKQNFYGNLLMQAMRKVYKNEFSQEKILSMISLTGTVIALPQAKGKTSEDNLKVYAGQLISFSQVLNGGAISQYACSDSKCENLKIVTVSQESIAQQVKKLYLGGAENSPDFYGQGVIGMYESNRGSLSASQKRQLLLIGEGINSQIKTLALQSPAAARDFVNYAASYIAYKYAVQEIEYTFRVVITAMEVMNQNPAYQRLLEVVQRSYQAYADVIATYSELADPKAVVEYYNNLQLQLNPHYGRITPK
ncbi:hypothetical protein CJP74_00020 [Psittacicella melopsittaci]|uniref:Conjugal transfer protein TraH n=1 Tax=Psittacicella melopsittaci TaxID=2028576 RepID=A0A3A1YAF3_9GAMM|nr:conjugal transfer protein TraH [Psittacicella melopsittaci]RIY34209.1 hypothetical protein CJP74_00020 [Psittacicella melopsittaci]